VESLTFWLGGGLAVIAGLACVTRRNAVSSVMWLVAAFLGMATLFFGMGSAFIGVIQILVYAGAIMILFLFVIMLLNLSPPGLARIDRPRLLVVGLAAALGFVGLVANAAAKSSAWAEDGTPGKISERLAERGVEVDNSVLAIGDRLFNAHVLGFEVASVLLLVAIIGAVVLTKKKV
jgi:NADH-quinone oxidoreductase subunit J